MSDASADHTTSQVMSPLECFYYRDLRANAQEQLSEDDATAKALKYVHKSTTEGSSCSNCMYIQGEAGQEWRPCAIFPGKLVNSKGWCSAWVKKPG